MKTVPIDPGALSQTDASHRILAHPASISHREGQGRHIFQVHPTYLSHTSDIRSALSRFEGWGEIYPASGRHLLKVFEIRQKRHVFKLFKGMSLIGRVGCRIKKQSPARLAYENAVRLIEMGVETPRPVGYVEDYGLLGLKRALYIAQEHPSASTLSTVFCRTRHFEQREEAIRAFVRFIHDLHEKGISFRRLEADNVLFYEKQGGWGFSLLSTHHVQFKHPSGLAERLHALAGLTSNEESLNVIAGEYALRSGENPTEVLRLLKAHTKKK